MTDQTNDAAQRSAHVTRGPAAQDGASVVREWREDGKLVACAEGVARMREELEAVRKEARRQAMFADLRLRQCQMLQARWLRAARAAVSGDMRPIHREIAHADAPNVPIIGSGGLA